MGHKLLENKLVCEISNRGFKEGLAKVHETSNKTGWGVGGVPDEGRHRLFCWGRCKASSKGPWLKKRLKRRNPYLCVPGIVKDRVSATPFGLWGQMVVLLIAIPSPFPEIKSRGKKIQQFTFQTLTTVNNDNIQICPLA